MNRWRLVIAVLALALSHAQAEQPAGKEIAEVVVQGNRLRTAQEIQAKMNTRPGTRYSEITAQEDAGRLLKEGWFTTNGVQLATRVNPDGRVSVFVQVIELPSTIQQITYRGANHFSRDDLDKMTGLKRGSPMSPAFNQAARQSLIRAYHEKGRYWTSVHLTKGGDLRDTEVVFDISEGPVVKVGGVEFKFFGQTSGDITTGRLRTQIQTSSSILGLIGGDFNPMLLEQDISKIADYYRNLGYLDVRVQRELIWSEDHRSVKIIFHTEEGRRYHVKKMQIDGNKTYDETTLLGFTDLRNGDPYDKFVIQADVRRLRDYYGVRGRPVTVRESLHQVGEAEVHLVYQVEEKGEIRAADVKIIGNTVTRDNVIRRQVNIYPGQILSFPDLMEAERNLSRLGIFDEDPANGVKPSVEIENPDVDEPYKNILVRVKEKPTGSFMVGAGVTSDAGVTGSVVINERNFDITRWPRTWDEILEGKAFRGAGQEFRIEAVPGTQMQRYTVSWREPYLFDSRYSLGLSGYFFNRSYLEYTEERVGGRVTLGRRINNIWSVNLTERVENVGISSVPFGAPPQITDAIGHSMLYGTRIGVTRDNRDNFLRPTSGSNGEIAVEEVLGDYQFPILSAEFTKYWTTFQRKDGSGKHVLAMKTQAMWAGNDAPVFERFYAGGFRTMRGFSFRGVGPNVDGYNVGGNFSWLNSLEYQIPVMANDNLYVVGFVDHGTVESSVTIKDYRVTAGLGLRISVPQLLGPVPLALDFGYPINKAPWDNKQIFSFWLGFFN